MPKIISIIIALLIATSVYADEDILKIDTIDWSYNTTFVVDIIDEWMIAPPTAINVSNPEGKQVRIDFGKDEVTYSGDLPVDEAAQLFFDATLKLYKKDRKCPHCGEDITKELTNA